VKQLSLTMTYLQNLLPVRFCSLFAYRKIQLHFRKKRRLFLNCVIERAVNLFISFLLSFFFLSFFLSLLVWPRLATHCQCTGLSLRLITLSAHTHSAGFPWMRDRPVSGDYTWRHTTFTRHKHSCRRRE
jgi:hypothetical protein